MFTRRHLVVLTRHAVLAVLLSHLRHARNPQRIQDVIMVFTKVGTILQQQAFERSAKTFEHLAQRLEQAQVH
jgi:hypothetical protein